MSLNEIANAYSAKSIRNSWNRGSDDAALDSANPVSDTPLTLSAQGTTIPYVVGRRRVGPLIAYVGDRFTMSAGQPAGGKGGGGGGSSGPPPPHHYFETGWHVLCVGPAVKLHQIWIAGQPVISAPIDASVTPSGTNVPTDTGQNFDIYWGEPGQPVNTYLGDPLRVQVTSRWPMLCYVLWRGLNLGEQPTWPEITYDIEVEVSPIDDPNPPKTYFLTGTTPQIPAGIRTYPDGGVGQNMAHVIAQLLFMPFPHGLGLPTSEFDLPSLEAIGVLMETENVTYGDAWLGSISFRGGTEQQRILASIFKDLGIFLSWNVITGLWEFKAIREELGPIPTIPNELINDELPELLQLLEQRPADRLLFTFSDIERDYKKTGVPVDDDGQASFLSHQRTRSIGLATAVDEKTAFGLAERIVQEELAGGARYTIHMNRVTRTLIPGEVFFIEEFPTALLRCLEVQLDTLAGKLTVIATEDFYGTAETTFFREGGVDLPPHAKPVQADQLVKIIEIPSYLTPVGSPIVVAAPRVRAHDQIKWSDLWLSEDDVTFVANNREFNLQTGGSADVFPISPTVIVEIGPTFFALGPPDTQIWLDLTADESAWRSGRQVACWGDEIAFVRNVEDLGGGLYRMRGLIRARYDTDQEAIAFNDPVFVFLFDQITTAVDPALIEPGKDLYLKHQPWTSGPIDLSAVSSVSRTIKGKGVVPMAPMNLRVWAPVPQVNSYRTGDDVTFRWSYRSALIPTATAGLIDGGTPMGDAPVEGEFELEIRTVADVLVRTQIVYVTIPAQLPPEFVYLNADLQADLGGEIDFKAILRNTNNGFRSDPIEITVEVIP